MDSAFAIIVRSGSLDYIAVPTGVPAYLRHSGQSNKQKGSVGQVPFDAPLGRGSWGGLGSALLLFVGLT